MSEENNKDTQQFNKEKSKRFSLPFYYFLVNIGAIIFYIFWIYEIKNNRCSSSCVWDLNFLENIFFLVVIIIWFAANKRLKYLYLSAKNNEFKVWFILMMAVQLIALVIYYLNQ